MLLLFNISFLLLRFLHQSLEILDLLLACLHVFQVAIDEFVEGDAAVFILIVHVEALLGLGDINWLALTL